MWSGPHFWHVGDWLERKEIEVESRQFEPVEGAGAMGAVNQHVPGRKTPYGGDERDSLEPSVTSLGLLVRTAAAAGGWAMSDAMMR